MMTNDHSISTRPMFFFLFLALVAPAFSIGRGGDCSRNRNGCDRGLTCIHGGIPPRPFQCFPYKTEGWPCDGEPFWKCLPGLRCAKSPGELVPPLYGTCVPPNLPSPKGGFCGITNEHRKCPSGYRCVIKGLIGHCEDIRAPSPMPSPSRSPMPVKPTPPPYFEFLSEERKERIRQKIKAAGGCNANVCFAIDGSGSISAAEFDMEKAFVQNVVSLLTDNPIELAAVQFSTSTNPIQSLTADDEQFNLRVQATNQIRGASFIAGGVNYCVDQLFDTRAESNKIVLLSDGRSNIGGSAVFAADAFRSIGGSVCAVGSGNQNEQELLDIVGGDEDLLFQVDNFFDVRALANHIETVTLGICSLLD